MENDKTEDHLERQLSNRHLQLIAIGGTIGTSLFVGSAHVLAQTGPSALLIYLLAGVTFFFGMRVLGELLLSNLKYKSFRDAIEDILGPRWGFVVGWMYLLFWVFTCVQDALGVATYIQYWKPGMPSWLVAIILIASVAGLNLIAVRVFGELEFWFSIIKVAAIIVITVICLAFIVMSFNFADGSAPNIANLWSHGGFFPGGISGFLGAFQIAFLAYAGIELVGAASAETQDPERNLPKAVNALPLRISLFYIVPMFLLLIVTPWDAFKPGHSPFVQVFTLAGIGIAATALNFILLTAAASGANSGVYASSRMLYGLAESKEAPKKFHHLSSRHVPNIAVVFTALVSGLVLLMLEFAPDHDNAYLIVSGMSSAAFVISWIILAISYIIYTKKYADRHANSNFKAPLGKNSAYLVIAVLGFCYILTFFDSEAVLGAIIGIVAFIILLGVYEVFHKKHLDQTEFTHHLYE